MVAADLKQSEARGFAGLLSMVSDIPEDSEAEASTCPQSAGREQSDARTNDAKRTAAEPGTPYSPTATPQKAPDAKKGLGWIWILAAVAGCIWLAVATTENNGHSARAPSAVPTPRYDPTPAPRPSTPSVPLPTRSEDMPYPGDGTRVFTQGNIRWCLFQNRRLEIMRRAVQGSVDDADVGYFNDLVTDYNARCGNFRYREFDMTSVRAELIVRAADLQSQAEKIMGNRPSRKRVAPLLTPQAPTNRQSESQLDLLRIEDATKVQQRLTELGFFIGKPDGIWSRKAREALREFKSANGLSQDDAWDEPTQTALFAQSVQRKTPPNPKAKPPKISTGLDSYYTPPPGTTANPLNRLDAINLQNRLAVLGFFAGQSDGVWGPASRNALRDFKAKNGLTPDDEWNAETERALAGEQAVRAAETFHGKWGDDAADCLTAPIQITEREARGSAGICKFGTVRRDENGWRIQAVCTSSGKTWSDNITLSVSDGRLTWSTGTLTKVYIKCGIR